MVRILALRLESTDRHWNFCVMQNLYNTHLIPHVFCRLEPSVARVLKQKNLLLLEKIASSLNWKDTAIHSDIRNGFKLTGNPLPSGIFEPGFKPASMEETELLTKK